MGRRFKRTTDFDVRYEKFIETMGYINDKYSLFFDRKEDETGNMDSIEQHISVSVTEGINATVRLSFYPRSYLPVEIKSDATRIFADIFRTKADLF
ncbi:hypothetical protein [Mucilaginibacter sp. NFX135]|uniref:hypothetical protein n=1 Tax=Mucilaginibacter sp. NFX135 TaxID=3402687 RepID=UPI003AFB55FC